MDSGQRGQAGPGQSRAGTGLDWTGLGCVCCSGLFLCPSTGAPRPSSSTNPSPHLPGLHPPSRRLDGNWSLTSPAHSCCLAVNGGRWGSESAHTPATHPSVNITREKTTNKGLIYGDSGGRKPGRGPMRRGLLPGQVWGTSDCTYLRSPPLFKTNPKPIHL